MMMWDIWTKSWGRVYCTPDIKVAEGFSGLSNLVNGKRYKMVFMMRVKPDRIKTDEMRPYRILLKEIWRKQKLKFNYIKF